MLTLKWVKLLKMNNDCNRSIRLCMSIRVVALNWIPVIQTSFCPK